jgi:hypothetical protein
MGTGTYGTESTAICASSVDLVLLEVPDSGFAELWLRERLFSRRISHDLSIALEVSWCSDEFWDSGCCLGGPNGESGHKGFEGGELHIGDDVEKKYEMSGNEWA